MPKREKKDETRALHIIAVHLGRTVERHDDGTANSMYDLRIGSKEAPDVAIECVGAVNQEFIETWNGSFSDDLLTVDAPGDWLVEFELGARWKPIKLEIEKFLNCLSKAGRMTVRADVRLQLSEPKLYEWMKKLRVAFVDCGRMPGSGRVYPGVDGEGVIVNTTGHGIAKWLGEFLREPRHVDILEKLSSSNALERHAFVTLGLSGAPSFVTSYFMQPSDSLPMEDLDLPDPVTAAWLIPSYGSIGAYWDGCQWFHVNAP